MAANTIQKKAIKTVMAGRKKGHGGTVHPNKAYGQGGGGGRPAGRNGGDYTQQGSGDYTQDKPKLGQLKAREAHLFARYQGVQGKQAKAIKTKLNQARHKLTVNLLGGTHGEGFNPGLSQKGQHKSTRQLLRAQLGSDFKKYYYTNPNRQYVQQGSGYAQQGRQHSLGNVTTSGTPQTTTGRKIGPPARRRRSGYGGY